MENNTQKSKKKLIIIIVSIVVAVLVAAGAVLGVLLTQNHKNDNKTSSNTPTSATASDPSSTEQTSAVDDSTTSAVSSNSESQSSTEQTVTRSEKIIKTYNYINEFATPQYQHLYFNDTFTSKRLPYWLSLPENYDPNEKYPVLLFLHGLGEVGNDDGVPCTHFRLHAYPDNGDIMRRAIIVIPQSPEWWSLDENYNDSKGWLSVAMRLLIDIEKTYSSDPNRIYVTGLSMGGFATWDLLARYGSHFAAAVPLCGGTGEAFANTYKNIPIWIFHGTADGTVSVTTSDRVYNAIIAAGGTKVKYSRLEGVQHNVWEKAYRNREMWSWMFSQNKATNPDASYEMFDFVTVCNSKGRVLFNQKEILGSTNRTADGVTTIGIRFTDNGMKKLTAAYNANNNEEFTLYIGQNKLVTFKYTAAPTDNTVYLSGFYDYDTSLEIGLFFSDIAYK